MENGDRMMENMDMQEIKIGTLRPDCIPGIRSVTIDENKIEAAITEKTKAIVPVHYAGVSCEMDKIMELAKKYNLTEILLFHYLSRYL